MIEQVLAIPTSSGGTSQATIQIPANLGPDQHIVLDNGQQIAVNNSGQLIVTGTMMITMKIQLPNLSIYKAIIINKIFILQNYYYDRIFDRLLLSYYTDDIAQVNVKIYTHLLYIDRL